MKKVILFIIYPFWFALSSTWLGNVITMCLTPMLPALFFFLFTPNILGENDPKGAAGGLGILCLFLGLPMAVIIMWINHHLRNYYEDNGYKTEIR